MFHVESVKDRRALAVYPMVLFYFIISWLVITYTPWVIIRDENFSLLRILPFLLFISAISIQLITTAALSSIFTVKVHCAFQTSDVTYFIEFGLKIENYWVAIVLGGVIIIGIVLYLYLYYFLKINYLKNLLNSYVSQTEKWQVQLGFIEYAECRHFSRATKTRTMRPSRPEQCFSTQRIFKR